MGVKLQEVIDQLKPENLSAFDLDDIECSLSAGVENDIEANVKASPDKGGRIWQHYKPGEFAYITLKLRRKDYASSNSDSGK